METYTCEKCGKEFTADKTYEVTKFFNYTPYPIYLCEDCARQRTPNEETEDEETPEEE